MGSKCHPNATKIVWRLTAFKVRQGNCRASGVNMKFVVSLKKKVLTEEKFSFASFIKDCLKWSEKRQSGSENWDSKPCVQNFSEKY